MSEEQSAVTTAIPKYGLPAPLPALFLSGTFPFLCFLCSQLFTSCSEPEDYRGNADIKFFWEAALAARHIYPEYKDIKVSEVWGQSWDNQLVKSVGTQWVSRVSAWRRPVKECENTGVHVCPGWRALVPQPLRCLVAFCSPLISWTRSLSHRAAPPAPPPPHPHLLQSYATHWSKQLSSHNLTWCGLERTELQVLFLSIPLMDSCLFDEIKL